MPKKPVPTIVPLNLKVEEKAYATLARFKNLLEQFHPQDVHVFVCTLGQDLTFVVIRDHNGQAQIVVRPKRDAKNMDSKEDKTVSSECPRHPMQEKIGPNPLYLNPVLEPLAVCMARGLFRDFKTADVFALEPPPYGEAYELVLDRPTLICMRDTFEKIEDGTLTGQILTGSRAEEGYSTEGKAQFAGHGLNPSVIFKHYMSSTSSVQTVSNILKLDREENLAEPFHGLTFQCHPKLWQALPAKLREDLEDDAEFAELNDQIIKLTEMIKTASSDEQSQNLEAQRQALYN
ncbi:hypothetical protein ACJ73_02582 [Blastomyces percursus]|uniref:Uncharacterized protein n=1 Tax=Blastomyces percursus TaxID=1658174 RepID=A0A1J9RBZ4_9EURO|nr:hypothetical protein ACJ73_02582 [Blastomyces percursus]